MVAYRDFSKSGRHFIFLGESVMNFDVIIIGAGPGGIFSAFELVKQNEYSTLTVTSYFCKKCNFFVFILANFLKLSAPYRLSPNIGWFMWLI